MCMRRCSACTVLCHAYTTLCYRYAMWRAMPWHTSTNGTQALYYAMACEMYYGMQVGLALHPHGQLNAQVHDTVHACQRQRDVQHRCAAQNRLI